MAVTLTGTGGLFTRIGKFLNIINVVNTLRGTTLVGDIDELGDNYNDDRDLYTGIESAFSGYQSQQGGFLSYLRTKAQTTLVEQVNADNPLTEKTVTAALKELISQMDGASATVDKNTVSGSATAGSSNNGDGICTVLCKGTDGKATENQLAEDIIVTCTSDAQVSGTAGREGFRARGEAAVTDRLSHLYPAGSGCNKSLVAILATSDVADGNLLTNSDFEDFTTANTPDDWTIAVGSAGSDIKEDSSDQYSGSKCLELDGDGATLSQIYQAVTLEPNTRYSFNCFVKFDSTPAAGALVIDLHDGSSVIADDESTDNTASLDLTGVGTSFESFSGTFITPRVLPSTVRIRIRLSTAISNTSSLFLDHLSLGESTELYAGGPSIAIHSGATDFVKEDYFTVATTNNNAGSFQDGFDKLFDMRGKRLVLPSDSSGTISDGLIA